MEEILLSIDHSSALIKSCDGRVKYKLSHLRSLYVLSPDTPQEFAEKFNLDLVALCKAIDKGKWESLRVKYTEGDATALLRATTEQLQAVYETELAHCELSNFQEKQQQEKLLRHRAQYGDLFLHDPLTGDLKLDHFGQPIPLPLPNSSSKLKAKISQFQLLEGLTRVLAAAKDAEARTSKKSPVMIDKTTQENDAIDAEVFGSSDE